MHERRTPHVNSTHRSSTITTNPPIPATRRGTQQRTGRTSLASVTNQQQTTDEQKETQRRIAARAATAMAQVRKRQPRSFMFWGDKRKAVIKRYPDGTQEILVPQTLTPEQKQYEFPPRSRLLKKLANSTAERQRLHSLQHTHTITAPNVSPTLPSFDHTQTLSPAALSAPTLHSRSFPKNDANVVISRPASVMEPDQSALDEWFSGKKNQQKQSQQQKRKAASGAGGNNTNTKEKAVMDWMTDVERSTSLLKKSSARSVNNNVSSNSIKPSSSRSARQNVHDVNIPFKSKAGKRWVSGSLGQNSLDHLSPPTEDSRKHYVRRRQLLKHGNKPWKAPTTISLPKRTGTTTSFYSTHDDYHHLQQQQQQYDTPLTTSSTIAVPVSSSSSSSKKVPRSSVSASPASKSGMVQLVEMFHKTLQDQQARAHQRMQQLETLLEEERSKRQDIQRTQQMTMSRLDTFMKKYQEQRTPPSPTLSAASSSPPASPSLLRKRTHHQQQQRPNLDAWMERITRLESSVENESKSRQSLQQSVAETVERVDALKRSVSRQAREHSTSRRELENQINQAISNLSTLAQQRNR